METKGKANQLFDPCGFLRLKQPCVNTIDMRAHRGFILTLAQRMRGAPRSMAERKSPDIINGDIAFESIHGSYVEPLGVNNSPAIPPLVANCQSARPTCHAGRPQPSRQNVVDGSHAIRGALNVREPAVAQLGEAIVFLLHSVSCVARSTLTTERKRARHGFVFLGSTTTSGMLVSLWCRARTRKRKGKLSNGQAHCCFAVQTPSSCSKLGRTRGRVDKMLV